MGDQLRVVSIEIKDVLGARSFAIEPGRITMLRGANASGKSTALQAVQAALSGGNLARLARVDPEGKETEPEVVLVVEGDRPGEHYRVERKGDKVKVRARVGESAALEDVRRPQSWLTDLFDPRGSNPVAFLTAPDKERALLLLEALPLKLDRPALLAEMGITADELRAMGAIPSSLHPLEELAFIREAVFRTRTGVNRDQTQQTASAEQLRRAIPAVLPEDVSEQIVATEASVAAMAMGIAREEESADAREREAVAAAEAASRLEEERVSGEFKAAAGKLRRQHEAAAAEIRADAERRIAADLANTEDLISGLKESNEAILDQAAATAAAVTEMARQVRAAARAAAEGRKAELAAAREKLASLRAQAEAGAKARGLHEQAEKFDAEGARLKAESERLTVALSKLDEHRRRLAQDLPIPGLSIEDKVIRVNGVPYEQLNTQRKIEIAVEVATLRARGCRLPVIFIDGAEALDSEHFQMLVDELKGRNVQAFLARVEDHELRVEVA